jgi:hypothetical protein
VHALAGERSRDGGSDPAWAVGPGDQRDPSLDSWIDHA